LLLNKLQIVASIILKFFDNIIAKDVINYNVNFNEIVIFLGIFKINNNRGRKTTSKETTD